MKTFTTYTNEKVNETWDWQTSTLKRKIDHWLDKLGNWLEKLFSFDEKSFSSTPCSTSINDLLAIHGCETTENEDGTRTYKKEDIEEGQKYGRHLLKGEVLISIVDDEEEIFKDDTKFYDEYKVKYDSKKLQHKELSFAELNKLKNGDMLRFQLDDWKKDDKVIKNIEKLYKPYHIHNIYFYDNALNFWGSCWYSVENAENTEIPSQYKNYLYIYGGNVDGHRASNWLDDKDGDMILKEWLDITIAEAKKINKSIEGVVMCAGQAKHSVTYIYGYTFNKKDNFYVHTFK